MRTIDYAQEILRNQAMFLDTETTGLSEHDEIVEVALITTNNKELLNNIVKPTRPIPAVATEIHGITNERTRLPDALDWYRASSLMRKHASSFPIAIYNAVFDLKMLKQTDAFHRIDHHRPKHVYDIMELANRHFHKHLTWDYYQSRFKRLSLVKCCELAGIEFEGKAHTALADAKATLELVKFIASDY